MEFAEPRCAVAPTPPRTRTPRNRTHTEPPTPSPVTQTFPRRRPQNHLPPDAALGVPASSTISRCSSWSGALGSKRGASTLNVESGSSLRRWRTALALRPALGQPGARSAEREDARRTATSPCGASYSGFLAQTAWGTCGNAVGTASEVASSSVTSSAFAAKNSSYWRILLLTRPVTGSRALGS